MNNGWIKLHRKMLDNPVVFKDADHVAVWVYLLLEATHKDYKTLLGGKPITLKPGQLITGRKKIANILRINEHKVERVLNLLKSEHQIEQQGTSRGSLITIVHWDEYQNCEQQAEQEMSNSRATSEQQVSTKQEYKEHKNNKNTTTHKEFVPPTLTEVRAYREEKNLEYVDADFFYEYYASNNWLKGNSRNGKQEPMKNWKQTMITWNKRDQEKHKPKMAAPVNDGLDILFGGKA